MSRRVLTILTILAALTVTLSPFGRDLFVGDETKYGQVVREMMQGHWLVPYLDGNPYSHKPPLHFWIVSALSLLTGTGSILPFVIQSLLGFVATALLVRHMATRLFGPPTGAVAGLIWTTFLLAWGSAQTARMDLTYVFLLTLSVWLIWGYLEGLAGTRSLVAAGAVIGTAILVKGPMVLVMVAVLLGLERVRRGSLRGGIGWMGALLLAAALPLIWLVPALTAGGAAYADELLVKQNIGRAVGSWVHREPFWFYLPRFPATYFPWFAAVWFGIVAIWKRAMEPVDHAARSFLLRWVLAVVIPYSLLSGKLDIYMLPALVPASMLAAVFLVDSREDWMSRWTVYLNRGVMVSFLLIGILVPYLAPKVLAGKPEAFLAADARVTGFFVAMAVAAAAALATSFVRGFRTPLRVSALLAMSVIVPLMWLAGPLMPLLNEESSGARLVRALEAQDVPGSEVALLRSPHLWTREMNPDLMSARHLDAHELKQMAPQQYPLVVVTRRDREGEVREVLTSYRRVDSVRMIGKEFDVWRRR